MSNVLEQAINYACDNPGYVAGICIAVLLVGVTQIVLTTSPKRNGVLTDAFKPFTLVSKTEISHNTRLFRFTLPNPTDTLGLALGRHISLRANINDREVRRPYTPVSSVDTMGFFELLIKVYPKPNGLMSNYLDEMELGDAIDVRGPLGKFTYSRNEYKKLMMVCGGTGITPMWQVFQAILDDPADETKVTLIFANITEEDILMKEQLDNLAATHHNFSIYYVLNEPSSSWTGGVGYVSKEMLLDHFGKPSADCKVLMCGPAPMNKAMKKHLIEIGYSDSQMFRF